MHFIVLLLVQSIKHLDLHCQQVNIISTLISTGQRRSKRRHKRIEWINTEDREIMIMYTSYKSYKEAKCRYRKIQNEEINVVELKYYSELDESAECDVRLFWHIVNRRRKTKSSNVCKLVTDEETASSPEVISKAFADHFSKLYIPNDHPNYDHDFKLHIKNKVKTLDSNRDNSCNDLICPVELSE